MRSLRLLILATFWILIIPSGSAMRASSATTCGGYNASCSSGTDCCSGQCSGGHCLCSTNDEACNSDTDCCTGFNCVSGYCISCLGQGEECGEVGEGSCCSGVENLICDSSFECEPCGNAGGYCQIDSDCCGSYLCTSYDACEVCGTPYNDVFCELDSDCCGAYECDGGECCSEQGDSCIRDTDCCGTMCCIGGGGGEGYCDSCQ